MIPDRQYINDTRNFLPPATVVELKENTHYMIGVVNLRTGVTYNLNFWRESNEYTSEG